MKTLSTLNKKIQVSVLKRLLTRDCGDGTVKGGYSCNCFWIYLYKNEDDFSEKNAFGVIRKFEDGFYSGIEFSKSDNKEDKQFRFNYQELSEFMIAPINHYRTYQIQSNGLYDLIFGLYFHRFNICYMIIKYELSKFIFNKRSLGSKKRYDFLKLLIDNYMTSNGFSYVDVMGKLHSNLVYSHPDFNNEAKKINALLLGLVNTGELKVDNLRYYLTGHAFKVMDEYEEQDRRHRSINRSQRLVIFLTLGLLIAALIQSEVIKIPTLLDFTK